jgi:hypothetical protein
MSTLTFASFDCLSFTGCSVADLLMPQNTRRFAHHYIRIPSGVFCITVFYNKWMFLGLVGRGLACQVIGVIFVYQDGGMLLEILAEMISNC